ncbi:MAG: hypothetical protein IJ071_08385 [Ruminococcus sp.]|nr:hypothetical protein [Ruminococcus sp.]
MEVNSLRKDTVERLRKVKKEQALTVANILEMFEKAGYYLSEATVKRVFSENADPNSFKYRDTIAPLADVLLDFYNDQSGTADIEALKSLIRDKNMTINVLIARDEERKLDYEKRIAHLNKQIERLEKNLDFREDVVNRKDEVIEGLLNKIEHKDELIERLLTKAAKE